MHSEHLGIGNQTMDDDDEYDEGDDMERKQSYYEVLPLEPPGTVQSLEIQQCLPVEFLGSGNHRILSNSHVQRDLKREFSIECNDEECEDEYVRKQSMECLRSALHEANKMFMHAKCIKAESPSNKLPDSKSIWIFTNQEDPSYGDEIQRTYIKVAARDALENGIDIHVLPFPKVDDFGNIQCNFDSDILYKSIVSPQHRMENNNCFSQYNDGTVVIEELLDFFDKAMSKVRKIATIPLLLPGWKKRLKEGNDDGRSTEIMLDLYPIVQQRSKGTPISVHQEKNKATIKKTCIVDPNENEVPSERIHHYVEFCGKRVPVRPADVAILKKMCNSHDKASLILFGFRPTNSFCLEHIIKKSYRAFANDRIVAGSERALFNLKEAMIRKEVYAVGELLLRHSSSSNMVAIFPEKELAGIVITPLPFKDDMRRVPKEDIGYTKRPVVDAAKKLISKSALNNVDFMHDFENPVLKYFFNYLESVSLGRELTGPERDDDMLRMNVDQMLERASTEIRELSLSLPEDEVPEMKQHGVKRVRKETSNQPQMKRKIVDIDEDWIQIYKDGTVAERTNAELKEFLRSIGERIGGKKDDLVDRIHRVIRNYLAKK